MKSRIAYRLLILLVFTMPAFGQSATEYVQGHEAAAGQVLVKFKTRDAPTILAAQWLEDIDKAETINREGMMRMHSRSRDTGTLLRNLARRSDVMYAEPDYILHTTTIPADAKYAELWALRNTGQAILGSTGVAGADLSAENAWAVTTGTKNVVVAVIDTGIDYTHPDLAPNVWNNPTGVGGCPIGTHGYNAIAKTCDPMDDNFHGTHVSGTIGAVGNNSVGVVGVNWNTSIMALKFLNSTGNGTTSNAIAAIEFAIQAKIAGVNVRVLSNSWGGGGFSQALSDEIAKANAYDILFVVAAGNASSSNDITPNYPSNYNLPNIVAVAATDNSDGLASFSNYGATTVHLGAPGVNILSTQPGNLYQYLSGTSMATPHVAGAAALILSVSTLTTAQLKNTLLASVDPVASLAGKTVTGGRLNLCKAIPACVPPDFSLSISPSSLTVPPAGGTAVYTVDITRTAGLVSPLNLTVSGLPVGVTAAFSPNPVSGASSTLTLTASSTTITGSYLIAVTAASTKPLLSHSSTATLVKAATTQTTWTQIAVEGDTVFLPRGTTYRFGIDTRYLQTATTAVDWTVFVYYANLGGDPAPNVVKELDIQGDGTGVIVNGVQFKTVTTPPITTPPPTTTWTKVAIEGDTIFLPKGTTYRFGIDVRYLPAVTTTADWMVLVYYSNLGGDPAPNVLKELDIQGDGTGVLVNGVPFKAVTPPPVTSPPVTTPPPPTITWTKVAVEGNTVFLPKGTTYRFGIDTRYLPAVTTTADWTVLVYYTNFGGDPAQGVVKELDVQGDGIGVIVNGVPFLTTPAPPPTVTWTKVAIEGDTVFLPTGTTYRFGIDVATSRPSH